MECVLVIGRGTRGTVSMLFFHLTACNGPRPPSCRARRYAAWLFGRRRRRCSPTGLSACRLHPTALLYILCWFGRGDPSRPLRGTPASDHLKSTSLHKSKSLNPESAPKPVPKGPALPIMRGALLNVIIISFGISYHLPQHVPCAISHLAMSAKFGR